MKSRTPKFALIARVVLLCLAAAGVANAGRAPIGSLPPKVLSGAGTTDVETPGGPV